MVVGQSRGGEGVWGEKLGLGEAEFYGIVGLLAMSSPEYPGWR